MGSYCQVCSCLAATDFLWQVIKGLHPLSQIMRAFNQIIFDYIPNNLSSLRTCQKESLTTSSLSLLDHKMFHVTQWQVFWGLSLNIKKPTFFFKPPLVTFHPPTYVYCSFSQSSFRYKSRLLVVGHSKVSNLGTLHALRVSLTTALHYRS